MPITYPLPLPANIGMESILLRRRSVVGVPTSDYDGTEQVQVHQGQWWEADVTLPPLNPDKAPAWEGFLNKLNGREGTFLLGDPLRPAPRGAAKTSPGTPVVDGNHAARVNEIAIAGAPANETGWLLEGDYFQIGTGASSKLFSLAENVDTDASGNATLLFWPKTRVAINDGSALILTNCKGVFRMMSNLQEIRRSRRIWSNYQFTCKEAF